MIMYETRINESIYIMNYYRTGEFKMIRMNAIVSYANLHS